MRRRGDRETHKETGAPIFYAVRNQRTSEDRGAFMSSLKQNSRCYVLTVNSSLAVLC